MDKQLYSANDPYASCTNMVHERRVQYSQRLRCEKFVLLKLYGKNRPNISTTTELIFTNVSALIDVCMGITKLS